MTVEELDIVITASVGQALSEINKLIPSIKKASDQISNNMNNVKTSGFISKVKNAVKQVTTELQPLSNKKTKVEVNADTKNAQKEITSLEKKIEALEEKTKAKQMRLDVLEPQIDKTISDTQAQYTPEGAKPGAYSDNLVDSALNSNKHFVAMTQEAEKLYTALEQDNQKLSEMKSQLEGLKASQSSMNNESNQTGSVFTEVGATLGGIKGKFVSIIGHIVSAVKHVTKFKGSMNGITSVSTKIGMSIKGMGSGFKSGIKNVLKYATALFSLRSIYSALSQGASAWLGSQNAQAQQTSANIEYLKYAIGSTLAPVIQFVTNLVYQLLQAIQQVAYAFSGVNIFAKASASSMKSASSSAKSAAKETKALAGVHDEINNISDSDSGSSGGGSGGSSPSMDLSNMGEATALSQALTDFFAPLVQSWQTYGGQVISAFKNAISGIGSAFSSMWKSVEALFTSGVIYSIISNILNSIGAIGQAWANAWNNDNNGTDIILTIAGMFDYLTQAILNVTSSAEFQTFLDGVLNAFSGIAQFIEPVVQGFADMWEQIQKLVMSTVGEALKNIGDKLKELSQNETAVEILKSVGEAIAIIVTVIGALVVIMGVWQAVTSPTTLIILAIVAAVTAVILIIKNWGAISEWFGNLWQTITNKVQEIWNNVKEFFVNLWNSIIGKIKEVWGNIKNWLISIWDGIKSKVENVFNAIKTFFSNVWNSIKTTITTVVTNIKDGVVNAFNNVKDRVTTIFNNVKSFIVNTWTNIKTGVVNLVTGIRDGVVNAFNNVKTKVTNIFNAVKTAILNVWQGIWNGIKGFVNSIIGGIESFVNGVIKGINFLLKGVSKVANAVGSLIGLDPINLEINQISIPRLAKGGVLYQDSLVRVAEYSGAGNNPEIVTPQNIMAETFAKVLSANNTNQNGMQPLNIRIGDTTIFDDMIDYINDKTKRTGKNVIVRVGD